MIMKKSKKDVLTANGQRLVHNFTTAIKLFDTNNTDKQISMTPQKITIDRF